MIDVKFYKCNDRFSGFLISGHAMYAEHGSDIVCAGVTSAVELAANYISENLKANVNIEIKENSVSLQLPDNSDTNAAEMLAALHDHLKNMADENGHIKITVLYE